MPVLSYAADDMFVITIKKSLLTNPDNEWVNRYEVVAADPGGAGDLLDLALKLVEFEKALHSSGVFFGQLTVSTWVPDSKPYDPAAFISSPLSDVGSRAVALDLLPLNTCLVVTRVAQFGRFGHLFYRGALYEDEQSSPAGKAILTSPSATATRVSGAVTSAAITGNFISGGEPLKLCMINKAGDQVRQLVGFVQGGISAVPTDHAWYNRTTP